MQEQKILWAKMPKTSRRTWAVGPFDFGLRIYLNELLYRRSKYKNVNFD